MAGAGARRAEVRRQLAAGDVTGLRDLAGRLHDDGVDITPEALRSDVRALGAIRVQHGDETVLALPVDDPAHRSGSGTSTERLTAEVVADPDWRIQAGVVAIVALFLLVALLGWLISV
jgi:hypothetical protein